MFAKIIAEVSSNNAIAVTQGTASVNKIHNIPGRPGEGC